MNTQSAITRFRDQNEWCSNFGPGDVCLGGITYPRREHAFVAHKSLDPDFRLRMASLPDSREGALAAKRAGRAVLLRPDWDRMRKPIMLQVVLATFLRHPDMAELLVATGGAVLIEGNRWHDNYWGSCTCSKCGQGDFNNGHNYLGSILMMVRDLVVVDQ
jgi:ribA/ribD-fused uncharacterized protein